MVGTLSVSSHPEHLWTSPEAVPAGFLWGGLEHPPEVPVLLHPEHLDGDSVSSAALLLLLYVLVNCPSEDKLVFF